MINPDIQYVEHSFLDYVMEVGEAFISNYSQFLDIDEKERVNELKSKKTASDMLRFLVWLCDRNSRKGGLNTCPRVVRNTARHLAGSQ